MGMRFAGYAVRFEEKNIQVSQKRLKERDHADGRTVTFDLKRTGLGGCALDSFGSLEADAYEQGI